jgi:tyrosine-protein kinase Etk/Wzc
VVLDRGDHRLVGYRSGWLDDPGEQMSNISESSGGTMPGKGELEKSASNGTLTLLIFMIRRKWFIAGCSILAALLGFGIVSIMDFKYKSSAVLRISNESGSSLASSLAGDLAIGGLLEGSMPKNSNTQAFLEVMFSREVLTKLINKYQLLQKYEKKNIEMLLPRLLKDLQCADEKNGIVRCEFVNNRPDSVKILLKDFVEISIARYDELQRKAAKEKTEFLRVRERDLKDSLVAAEIELLGFAIKNGILDASEQSRLSLGAISEIEASKAKIDLQLKLARSTIGADASQSLKMQQQSQFLGKELNRRLNDTTRGSSLALPPKIIPKVVLEERRLRVNMEGFRFLYQLASKERIAEESKIQGSVSPVQLLQEPYIPDWKSGPKRLFGLMVGFTLGGALSILFVVVNGVLRRELPVEDQIMENLQSLIDAITSLKS